MELVVRGDGTSLRRQSHHAPDYLHSLPSGLGRDTPLPPPYPLRLIAAIVVSASTGQVTLFRNGIALPLEKPFDG